MRSLYLYNDTKKVLRIELKNKILQCSVIIVIIELWKNYRKD